MPNRSSSQPRSSTNGGGSKQLNDYQLGDLLGKGAFGQVYRALNWATGETVAVKEIQLANIPKAELGEIMSEIDLLKNLNHPNIVKYKGFVKTREYLYIILEFCENGSLHNISKKFGKFPENLVAVYISQVLDGLVYLHDQGVIHRDIKGANLLTNKDGTVKLADFGVASTATTGMNDAAVVGSPYWMAPEIIEQSGATTASDIWSVGATAIELLEGKPPYHFLDPMPALFRIVQDDCPPIPDGASPVVKDFLMHCFQKDPNLRISAKKLLRHPWMMQARRQLGRMDETERLQEHGKRPQSNYNFDDAVAQVQEWNEALRSPSRPSKHPARSRGSIVDPGPPSPTPKSSSRPSSGLVPSTSAGSQPALITSASAWRLSTASANKSTLITGPPRFVEKIREPVAIVVTPEEQTDNWDDDFEEGISFTKLQAIEKTTGEEEEKVEIEDLGKTIRPPGRSPPSMTQELPSMSTSMAMVEDYSDFADEEAEDLEAKLANFKMKNAVKRGLFHPSDIKTVGLGNISPSPSTAPLPILGPRRMPSKPSSSPVTTQSPLPPGISARSISQPYIHNHTRTSSSTNRDGSLGRAGAESRMSDFDKYAEDDDEDYDDIFGKANGNTTDHTLQTLQLNTRLSNKSWLGDEDEDEEDPFAEIDEGFDEDDLETNVQRDKHARLCNMVNTLIDELSPAAPDFQLRDACDQLMNIMVDTPEMQDQLVSSHGMLAILEVLEGRCSRDVAIKLLQIVNLVVTADAGSLESFCLIGGIPVIMGFTSKKYASECRLEASNFIRLLCHTSVLTLQMFIACRGLKVLVELLDEDYTDQADLVEHALNGIGNVFELQSPTTKNDFCRMFIREGLLDPLSSALLNVMSAQEGAAAEMKMKIIQILVVFCQVSQSDIHVRNALGTRKVVRRLLRACELLEPEYLVQMLKAVKHLSMNATLLEVLQNANSIEILNRLLDEQSSGPYSTEISNHIFQTLYNLCRLNKSRQEEAAQAGIISSLKRVIESKSPLKQFALPILCDLASAGKGCRKMLWQHDGLSVYMRLLSDPYFQVSAMEAILSWLQDETARVEDMLTQPEGVQAILDCFVTSKSNSFENLLDPLLKMCRQSQAITIALGTKPALVRRIIDKLGAAQPKAVVRLNLLRLLRTVCEAHPSRGALVERYGLYDIVRGLSREDGAVLVRELAREILPILKPALKPAAPRPVGHSRSNTSNTSAWSSSDTTGTSERSLLLSTAVSGLSPPKSGIVPKKRVRRTGSEIGTLPSPLGAQSELGHGRPPPGKSPMVRLPSRTQLGDLRFQRPPAAEKR